MTGKTTLMLLDSLPFGGVGSAPVDITIEKAPEVKEQVVGPDKPRKAKRVNRKMKQLPGYRR